MTNQANKVISVSYELKTSRSNGEIIEKVTADAPLVFISGTGNLLEAFENNLSDLITGDSFSFSIPCDQAYGEQSDKAIVDLPIDAFYVNGELDKELVQIGNVIPMRDQSGRRLNGTVKEISTETVKMDFNHPLAGDDLHFSGKVEDIRDATPEEIAHGHIHNEAECGDCGDEGCNGHCH